MQAATQAEQAIALRLHGVEVDLEELQGLWTEALYLKISGRTNQLLEFTDGALEALPMPTRRHQMMLLLLYGMLQTLLSPRGIVLVAPMRLQIRPGKYREPDILLLCDAGDPRSQDAYWLGADLVVEIVSPDDPDRDLVTKRADYAEARIPEYWVVNPIDETITVLALDGAAYREHGVFPRGQGASSALLAGFTVSVGEVFDLR